MTRVRRYATATFTEVDEAEGEKPEPIRFAFLFLYGDRELAAADAKRYRMEGPFLYQDERSWLVAWEGTPEQREEIRSRFLELDGPLAWDDTLMPEVPVPQSERGNIRVQSNAYESMEEAFAAFGL